MPSKLPTIKLFAVFLVAWAALGTTATGGLAALTVGVLLVLLAVLDAGQAVGSEDSEKRRVGVDGGVTDADIGALVRRLFGVAVGPFYLVLGVLACLGIAGRGDGQTRRQAEGETWGWGDSQSMKAQAEATMCGGHGCGSGAGCGTGGCGASSGGACGCGSGAKKSSTPKAKPAPAISQQEVKARTEAIQKRTMTTPAANLPGIGPDAKPLPPGLTPNPNVELPPSAQKLLDAPKAPVPNPPAPSAGAPLPAAASKPAPPSESTPVVTPPPAPPAPASEAVRNP